MVFVVGCRFLLDRMADIDGSCVAAFTAHYEKISRIRKTALARILHGNAATHLR